MNALGAVSRDTEELRSRLAAIVASSDDAIISKTLDGIIVTWNEGAARIFGYAAEEVVGKPVTVLIPRDRLDEEPKILARLRKGERVDHFETIRVRKDGTLLDISLSISPVRNAAGEIVGASKIARDITQQKRAEEALRESNLRFRLMPIRRPCSSGSRTGKGRTWFNDGGSNLPAARSSRSKASGGRRTFTRLTSRNACRFTRKDSIPACRFSANTAFAAPMANRAGSSSRRHPCSKARGELFPAISAPASTSPRRRISRRSARKP